MEKLCWTVNFMETSLKTGEPVRQFEWRNLCLEASSKYQSEIPECPNNLHGFHWPGKKRRIHIIAQLKLHMYPHLYRKLDWKEKKTFSWISKSNWILCSVTILLDFPWSRSGVVAIMSWQGKKKSISMPLVLNGKSRTQEFWVIPM